MSHLIDIVTARCKDCGKRASMTLINDRSASIGDYCATHGGKALLRFRQEHGDRTDYGKLHRDLFTAGKR
jgi:hypothetical protein